MEIRKIILFVFIWLLFLEILKAQSKNIYTIGGSYLFGSNINKNSDREFGQTNPIGIEIYFHHNRNGSKYWEKVYNYPHTGWTLTWIDHKNEILGNLVSLNRYIDYVFLRKKYFEFYLKAAGGIMYATKFYETGTIGNNNFNNAISQPVNFSSQLGLGFYIYPVNNLGVHFSGTISHFSNGALSQPNDGLNLALIQLGLAYVTGKRFESFFNSPELEQYDRDIKFNIIMSGGVKQLTSENKKKYPLFSFSVYMDKKLARVSALNIGLDGFLNYGVKHSIENETPYKEVDFKKLGISAGHELFIDRIGILLQLGYHFYSPYPDVSRFYQKAGVKYYITDVFFAAITVRVFKFEISDEITGGLGVRL